MTQLNLTPSQVGDYTIPQVMCLMSDAPRETERATDFSQYKAILDREAKAEKEWAVK